MISVSKIIVISSDGSSDDDFNILRLSSDDGFDFFVNGFVLETTELIRRIPSFYIDRIARQ